MFYNLAFFELRAHFDKKTNVVKVEVAKSKDGVAQRWVYYKRASFGKPGHIGEGIPVIRHLTGEEMSLHLSKTQAVGPQPDLAAENATGARAQAKVAEDVRRALVAFTVPTPLREVAQKMLENDPGLLEVTQQNLNAKEAETLSPAQIVERCLASQRKRLQRLIGSDAVPGELAPFVLKVGGKFAKPYRLILPQSSSSS